MSGWGRGGGAHLLLGGASVPLATPGQGRAQGPRCRGRSLRLGGGLGTWSWQVRLGKQGGWKGEVKNLFVVSLLAVVVPTGSLYLHQPWSWLGPHIVLLDLRSFYYPLTRNNSWTYVDRTFLCTPKVRIPSPRPPRKRLSQAEVCKPTDSGPDLQTPEKLWSECSGSGWPRV